MQNREIYSGTNPVFQRVEGDCSYDYLQCFHNFSGQIKVVLFFSNYKRPSDCRTTTSTSFPYWARASGLEGEIFRSARAQNLKLVLVVILVLQSKGRFLTLRTTGTVIC